MVGFAPPGAKMPLHMGRSSTDCIGCPVSPHPERNRHRRSRVCEFELSQLQNAVAVLLQASHAIHMAPSAAGAGLPAIAPPA